MPRGRVSWKPLWLSVVVCLMLIAQRTSAQIESSGGLVDVAQMSVLEIEDALQQCPLVQDLNRHRLASKPPTSSYASQIFSALFPGTPAVNALLATLYISGPPNFLLALCPPNIDPSSLSVMVAFAVGGLLGDTIFHLLPEIFLGEAAQEEARFVLVAPNKNLLLGVAILVGFMTFVAMDKALRIATGGEGGHDHSHHQKKDSSKDEQATVTSALASGISSERPDQALKSRRSTSSNPIEIPKVSNALLQKLTGFSEPERSKQWLRAVLEEDAESDVTQLKLWQAYQSQLKGPHVPAADFIRNMSSHFNGAEAQTVLTADKDKTSSKYIIKGIRPRSSALTLHEHNTGTVKRKQPSLSQRSPRSPPESEDISQPASSASPSIRLSAYLNLIADFTHNITDGLALSSSFYASPTLGATTTVAVFFHEIPHEVGDFALLIQSGFSKRRAMGAQFVTALGALIGTCLGIAVQELGKDAGVGNTGGRNLGLAGTGLGWGDLLLPFTAGTFLYVGTVAVIPELLETGADKYAEVRKTAWQFAAMTLGAGIMLA
ncbi:hypothetical protein MMC07_000752 [Pseudocyphellaria aurata]|nr:hypothetical protein [Pseudocyphellaria aurata]